MQSVTKWVRERKVEIMVFYTIHIGLYGFECNKRICKSNSLKIGSLFFDVWLVGERWISRKQEKICRRQVLEYEKEQR
jgi:hypothetical protein